MKFITLFIALFCTCFNGYNQTVITNEKSNFPEVPYDSLIAEIQSYQHFTAKIPADTVDYDKIEKCVFYVNYDNFDTFTDSIQKLFKKDYSTLFVLDYSKSKNITYTDILSIYRLFNTEYQKNPSDNCKLFVPNILKKFEKELMSNKPTQNKVTINITKEGLLYIENEKLDLKGIKLKLKEYVASQKIQSVIIVAEVNTPFKNVTDVMGVANKLKLRCILAAGSKY